jgi:hypothetical protein
MPQCKPLLQEMVFLSACDKEPIASGGQMWNWSIKPFASGTRLELLKGFPFLHFHNKYPDFNIPIPGSFRPECQP